jgi:ribosome modulation factor
MINNYLVTSSQVTIITDGQTLVVPQDHVSYQRVIDYLKTGDYEEAVKVADAAQTINDFGQGQVYVQGGVVYHNGSQLDNSLARRIMSMVRDGFDVNPMVKFLENLMMNPSSRAVSELYRFLECNNLPITDDGYFLAYKNVNEDYKDKYSGKFDNSVGSTCQMPRNQVMDDPNQTCSAGLHFCSIEYLNGMWGHSGHTMIIKINPADVVSIPVDYNNSKGRCCKYTVIGEHHDGEKDTLSESSVWQSPYEKGYDAGFEGSVEQNPYPRQSEAYQDWYDGYEDGEVDNTFLNEEDYE